METLIALFVFGIGVIIGSFLNVVILRLNTGKSFTKGRSLCFSCGKGLGTDELIPLVSFLVQKGKCIGCKSKISWQYPLVELITGLLFLIVFQVYGISLNLVGFVELVTVLFMICVLIVISVYDIHHKMIPDVLSLLFFISAFMLASISNSSVFALPSISTLVAGPMLGLFFFALWVITRGRGMGLGDAKLALGIGLLLGASSGIVAVLFSFWIGALWAIILILVQKILGTKGLSMKSEIPFGPFLVIATLIVFFLKIDLVTLSQWMSFY